jgi:radical SAM superfamily enzyme YgiQ (UPF0313 family)
VLEKPDGRHYPSRTLEEGLEIRSLDALLVSCSFELDYLHFLRILEASGIQPIRSKRGSLPLIIVGGTAPTANPEPMAPFSDAIAVGDAEVMLPQILDELQSLSPLLSGSRFDTGRDELYDAWGRIEGVYVPGQWEDDKGRFDDRGGMRLTQASAANIDAFPSYTPIVSPDGVYGAKNLVEIGRGCTTRCRFCLISYISPAGPGRTRSMQSVLDNARIFLPDQASIGLVSSSVSDHPTIVPIINTLASDGYEVSVSSLKAKSTTREIIDSLAAAGAKSATFAPEHGSESIRKIVCKEMTYEDVKSRIEWCFDAGIKKVKLYFVTGFEEETADDLNATPEFVLSLARDLSLASKPQGFRFTIGLAPFVPKPSTPFQRRAMEDESTLKRKMKQMLDPLKKHPRIDVETESPRASILQCALSQGGRDLAAHMMHVAKSKEPILQAWEEALAMLGDQPTKRLPWDFIKRPALG